MPPREHYRRIAKVGFHRQIVHCAWLLPIPALVVALVLLWCGNYSVRLSVTITLGLGVVTGILAYVLRERLGYSLRTLTNVLAAMREGDYSIRAHAASTGDPLGGLAAEINMLGDTLRAQRLGAMEASALLHAVMEELDVAIFAFDERHRLRLGNRAAEKLLSRPVEQLLGRKAHELGLESCLEGDPVRIASMSFPGGMGRFGFRRTGFRQDGKPHQLLVLSDLSRALRDEERLAWQRLLRVLGHELNNSLAPIKSVAGSLEGLCRREPKPADWLDDMRAGLALISSRAEALSRFMQAYSQLARLPAPKRAPLFVADWIQRIALLERRLNVEVVPGPPMTIHADGDQLDQLLINLVRNAADAVLSIQDGMRSPQPGEVAIRWTLIAREVEVRVEDAGPGLSATTNLFVPFFTTKPHGTGIGLALSRQIAEAHGGSLILENRNDRTGCLARLRLPVEDG